MELIENNACDWMNDEEQKDLLRGMLMTACDLGAITKPWDVEQRVTLPFLLIQITHSSIYRELS